MTQLKKFISALTIAIPFIFMTSCGAGEEILEALSEGDAAEIIEATLQSNSGGLTSHIEDLAAQLVEAVTSGEICDSAYNTTLGNSYQGNQLQANYSADLNYELTCNLVNIPQEATFAATTASTYTTPRLDSDDDATFSGDVAGIQPSSASVVLDGTFNRNGTQEANFRQTYAITSTLSINLVAITVNKMSGDITAGSATFSFTGSTQSAPFSYTGSITFNGNGTATLIINGTSYTINL